MSEKRKRDEPKKKKRKPKRAPNKVRHFPENADMLPCPLCGKTNFEWGFISNATYTENFQIVVVAEKLEARLCLNCGNIQTQLRSGS